jgi:hypothetical protein
LASQPPALGVARALHPYRLGKNPNIVFSEERKQAAMKALSKARIAPAPEIAPLTGLPEAEPVQD